MEVIIHTIKAQKSASTIPARPGGEAKDYECKTAWVRVYAVT